MRTEKTTSPERAAAYLRRGGVVAFPTETVYGLGADAMRADAVARIFDAKERPPDNPLIVHICERTQLNGVVSSISPAAEALMERFFPGPLTLVLPKKPSVPSIVTAGLDTVAIRMPDLHLTTAFLRACGTPVAAPSANRSGRPSSTTWQAVAEDMEGRIDCILQGSQSAIGLESTVVDCTTSTPFVLRAGAVSLEALRTVTPAAMVSPVSDDLARRSPGTRHRHYAPEARVHMARSESELAAGPDAAYIGIDPPPPGLPWALSCVCPDAVHYAFELYHFFRRCDAAGVRRIICQPVPEEGLGGALMDRIRRAEAAGEAS